MTKQSKAQQLQQQQQQRKLQQRTNWTTTAVKSNEAQKSEKAKHDQQLLGVRRVAKGGVANDAATATDVAAVAAAVVMRRSWRKILAQIK